MWCLSDVGRWWLELQWQKKAHFCCWISFVDWLKWRRAEPSFSVCILFTDTDLTQSIPLVILYWIQVPVVSEELLTQSSSLWRAPGQRIFMPECCSVTTTRAGTKLESCLWRRTLRGRCRGRSSSLIVFATSFKHRLSHSWQLVASWSPPASSCW